MSQTSNTIVINLSIPITTYWEIDSVLILLSALKWNHDIKAILKNVCLCIIVTKYPSKFSLFIVYKNRNCSFQLHLSILHLLLEYIVFIAQILAATLLFFALHSYYMHNTTVIFVTVDRHLLTHMIQHV